MNTYISDQQLSHYMSLWDAAVEKMSKSNPVVLNEPEDKPIEVSAGELLQERRKASKSPLEVRDMIMLSEEIDRIFSKKSKRSADPEIGDIATDLANSPNPQYITSMGKDQEVIVTPEFSNGKNLEKIHNLKIEIEELERDVHRAEVGEKDKEEKKLNKRLDSLRSKLEELCDALSPHRIKNAN